MRSFCFNFAFFRRVIWSFQPIYELSLRPALGLSPHIFTTSYFSMKCQILSLTNVSSDCDPAGEGGFLRLRLSFLLSLPLLHLLYFSDLATTPSSDICPNKSKQAND
jgi:hypothetical protein